VKDSESMVKVLHVIGKEAETSQSNIAKSVGISVGKVNYILKELYKKGIVKTERFLKLKKQMGLQIYSNTDWRKRKSKNHKGICKKKNG